VTWALVVAGLLSIPFVVALAVDPITRRSATRSPLRRPTEALLVVLGSMLGTAIITGSLIVGDTIDRSIRAGAYEQLGPIDQIAVVSGLEDGAAFVAEFGSLETIDPAAEVLDGVLPIVTTQVAVVGRQTQPRAQLIEVDFDAARSFGGDPAATGIVGPTPHPGEAVVSRDLALATEAGVGDTITVYAYGVPVELEVVRILDRTGVAGYWPVDARQQSYNVLVTPGSLAAGLSGVELPPGVAVPDVTLAFSNHGGVESGAALTDRAIEVIDAATGGSVAVQPVKRSLIEQAEAVGSQLSQLYFTMGMFAVAAGVLLLVNIFVMLSDERRSQLGMLRALGMRRSRLVLGFASEGWLYSIVAASVGALVGIQLGGVIAWRADQALQSENDLYALDLTFTWTWATVAQGFAIGFVISLLTIVVTSLRISRLNVIAAIRDLPTRRRRVGRAVPRLAAAVLVPAGIAATVWAIAAGNSYLLALAPMAVAVGAALAVTPRFGPRVTVTGAALVVLIWAAMVVPVLGWLDITTEVAMFLVQGLTMCAAGVAFVMVHQKAFGVWLSERFGGSLPLRIGLAYPVAKGFRTAMTLAMFAIVVLTIVYLAFISLMFRRQATELADDLTGGYDLLVASNPSDPIPVDELLAVDRVSAVAPLGYGAVEITLRDRTQMWPVTGVTSELVAAPPSLRNRGAFATDDEAWQAVLDDPGLVIADEFLLNNGGPVSDPVRVGDVIVLSDPVSGASAELEVAALAVEDYLVNGPYISFATFEQLFGPRAVTSRYYVAVESGADPEAVAATIGRSFAEHGAESNAAITLVDAVLAQSTGLFTLMQQFVGVGLLVGVAGLGVIMVRSVRERRRDIGVFRSLGLAPAPVARSFLIEASFITAEGVLLGIVIALVGTYGLVLNDTGFMAGFSWAVPWGEIIGVAVLTFAAAAATAVIPSLQASRIHPAQALRIVD
jgi:putative ABC transport system permease protein